MKSSMVYLAGPIHGVTKEEARDWRRIAKERLEAKGISSLNPYAPFWSARLQGREIVNRDKGWIMSCDTVLANCTRPGWGTAMEILFAWEQHIQVMVVSAEDSPWLNYHATKVVRTLDEALEQIGSS